MTVCNYGHRCPVCPTREKLLAIMGTALVAAFGFVVWGWNR